MKAKTQDSMADMNRYNVSIAVLIVLAAVFILAIWIWFGSGLTALSEQAVELNSLTR